MKLPINDLIQPLHTTRERQLPVVLLMIPCGEAVAQPFPTRLSRQRRAKGYIDDMEIALTAGFDSSTWQSSVWVWASCWLKGYAYELQLGLMAAHGRAYSGVKDKPLW